jgi:hypothetical protein
MAQTFFKLKLLNSKHIMHLSSDTGKEGVISVEEPDLNLDTVDDTVEKLYIKLQILTAYFL